MKKSKFSVWLSDRVTVFLFSAMAIWSGADVYISGGTYIRGGFVNSESGLLTLFIGVSALIYGILKK